MLVSAEFLLLQLISLHCLCESHFITMGSSSSSCCEQHLAPNNNPLLWVLVNGFCIVASASLLILTLTDQEESASSVYLPYSLVTTIIWCIELGIKMKYHAPNWQLFLELAVAFYFTFDSSRTIYMWTVVKDRPESLEYGLIFDTFIFTLGTMIDAIPFWTNKEHLAGETEQPVTDLELQVDTNVKKDSIESQLV